MYNDSSVDYKAQAEFRTEYGVTSDSPPQPRNRYFEPCTPSSYGFGKASTFGIFVFACCRLSECMLRDGVWNRSF